MWRITPAEFSAWVKAWQWRDIEAWMKLAQHAAWTMNMWSPKGVLITPEKLLGPKFLEGTDYATFRTKEDWERYKADVTKMAKFHSKILRQIKAGTRQTKTVMLHKLKAKKPGEK